MSLVPYSYVIVRYLENTELGLNCRPHRKFQTKLNCFPGLMHCLGV